MITSADLENDLRQRIQSDLDYFKGKMPEGYVIAWRGYLMGMAEWAPQITPSILSRLRGLLPEVVDDPALQINKGRE